MTINRASACTRKIGFDSRAAARMAIKSMKRNGKPTNKLTVYTCTYCHMAHIGTKDQKKKHA